MVSFFINLDKSSETVELPAKYSAVILAKESEENGIHIIHSKRHSAAILEP